MGLKNPNKTYYEHILRKFNVRALNEGIKEASVKINFEWSENGNTDIYEIERKWNLHEDNKLTEKVLLFKNNIKLDSVGVEDTENYFREAFPQKLFDFFFFDGEDIAKLISGEYLEKEIKEATHTLFGMDIFKSLNTDLGKYVDAKLNSKEIEEDKKRLKEKEEEVARIESNYNSIETRITEDKIRLDELKQRLKNTEKRFKKIGGEIYENRSNKALEITNIEKLRQDAFDSLKDNMANLLPFYMNLSRLREVNKQIELEKTNDEGKVLKSSLENPLFKEILEKNIGSVNDENYINFKKSLVEAFNIDETPLHNLSYDNREKVKSVYSQISKNYKIEALIKVETMKRHRLVVDKLKAELSSIKGNEEIDIILAEISNTNNEINEINEKIIKEEELLKKESEILFELNKEVEEIRVEVIKKLKNENKTSVITSVQSVLEKYINKINEKKLKVVKTNFIEMFNKLHRKKGFIKEVEIDNKTLEIKLYHEHGLLDNRLLSAGEKQVYILSLLLAFLKASGRVIPLVFDTLLGRLDREHRENIIKEYLPNASKQVLILSTDTEITKESYEILKKFIAKEYTNNYNVSKQELEVTEGYFV
jgi:DNA sulfur modification protein DndD